MAMANAKLDAIDLFPELDDRFWDAIKNGQQEAEKGVRFCGVEPIPMEDIIGTHDPAVTTHLDDLINHFENVLTSESREYSFVEVGKPKQ